MMRSESLGLRSLRGSDAVSDAMSSLSEDARQPERDRRDVSDESEDSQSGAIERPDRAHRLPHRDLAHGASDELHRPDRRRVEANAVIEDHDHAEMHGIDPE